MSPISYAISRLAPVLSHNTIIKSFNFSIHSSFKPDTKAITELAEALKTNTSITSFRSDIACEHEETKFVEIFETNTAITSLYFHATAGSAALELFKNLKTSTSITSFSFYGNKLEYKEAVALADILKINKFLIHLHVDSGSMQNDECITLFSQALARILHEVRFKVRN